jgi:LysM repeat protein
MRWLRLFALLFLPLFTLLLPSCVSNSTGSNPGKHPSGVGPFDRNGNYVEAWADTPSKWGKKSSFSMASNSAAATDTPEVASNDEPPADAVPLPLSGSSPTPTVVKTTAPIRKSGEVEVASLSRPKPKVTREDDDDRPKSTVKKSTTSKSKQTVAKNSKSKPTAKELAAAKTKAKSKATASAAAKSKSKTTASTTAKKKPATRYTVKKGDNLVKIADRYNTTAAAIRKANGLKGAVVSPGKTLVIPKG